MAACCELSGCLVPDRSAHTLLPIINDHVEAGTRVITDCWASYRQLQNHATVNHSLKFVDPEDRSVHTNTVERFWRSAKDFLRLRKSQCDPDTLQKNLDEFLWRRHHKDKIFAELLYWVAFYHS